MKKIVFGLIATVLFVNLSIGQTPKSEVSYFDTKLNFTYKFKDRTELVSLLKRIIVESETSNLKKRDVSDFQLEIGDNELTYNPIATNEDSAKPCPEGFTHHGKFTSEKEISAKVAEIAAPVANCCPKVTIILDRTLTGVNICSKLEK